MKEKKDFEWKKLKYYKKSKNGHFPKRLVRDFVRKSKFLLSLFFTEIVPERIVFRYLWKKRMILSGKNWSFKKGQKMDISKGVSPWILSKNWIFSYCCFSQKLSQKRSFLEILNRTQSLKDQKTKFQQWPKNGHFLKG